MKTILFCVLWIGFITVLSCSNHQRPLKSCVVEVTFSDGAKDTLQAHERPVLEDGNLYTPNYSTHPIASYVRTFKVIQ